MPVSSTDVQNLIAGQMQNIATMQQAQRQFSMSSTPNQQQMPVSLAGQMFDPTNQQLGMFGAGVGTGAMNAGVGMAGLADLAAQFHAAPAILSPMTMSVRAGVMAGMGGGLGAGLAVGAGTMGAYTAAGAAANYMFIDPFRTGAQMMGQSIGFAGGLMPQAPISQLMPLASTYLQQAQNPINARMGAPTFAELQALTLQGFGAGTLRPTDSVYGMTSQVNQLIQDTRGFSSATGLNVNDAFAARQTLLDLGATKGHAASTYLAMKGMSEAVGMDLPEMTQAVAAGARGAHRMGISRERGITSAISQTAMFRHITKNKLFDMDEEDIGELNQAGQRFFSGERGQHTLAAMMDESGHMDVTAARQIAAGTMSREEINRRYRRVAGSASSMDQLRLNQQSLTGSFLSEYGPQGVSNVSSVMTRGLAHGDVLRAQDLGLDQMRMGQLASVAANQSVITDDIQSLLADSVKKGTSQKGMGAVLDEALDKVTKGFRDKVQRYAEGVSAGASKWAEAQMSEFDDRLGNRPNDMSMSNAAYRARSVGNNALADRLYGGMANAPVSYQPLAGSSRHMHASHWWGGMMPRIADAAAEGTTAADVLEHPQNYLMPSALAHGSGALGVPAGIAAAGWAAEQVGRGAIWAGNKGISALAGKGDLLPPTAPVWTGETRIGTTISKATGMEVYAEEKVMRAAGWGAKARSWAGNMMSGVPLDVGAGRAASYGLKGVGYGLKAARYAADGLNKLAKPLFWAQLAYGVGERSGAIGAFDTAAGDEKESIELMKQTGLLHSQYISADDPSNARTAEEVTSLQGLMDRRHAHIPLSRSDGVVGNVLDNLFTTRAGEQAFEAVAGATSTLANMATFGNYGVSEDMLATGGQRRAARGSSKGTTVFNEYVSRHAYGEQLDMLRTGSRQRAANEFVNKLTGDERSHLEQLAKEKRGGEIAEIVKAKGGSAETAFLLAADTRGIALHRTTSAEAQKELDRRLGLSGLSTTVAAAGMQALHEGLLSGAVAFSKGTLNVTDVKGATDYLLDRLQTQLPNEQLSRVAVGNLLDAGIIGAQVALGRAGQEEEDQATARYYGLASNTRQRGSAFVSAGLATGMNLTDLATRYGKGYQQAAGEAARDGEHKMAQQLAADFLAKNPTGDQVATMANRLSGGDRLLQLAASLLDPQVRVQGALHDIEDKSKHLGGRTHEKQRGSRMLGLMTDMFPELRGDKYLKNYLTDTTGNRDYISGHTREAMEHSLEQSGITDEVNKRSLVQSLITATYEVKRGAPGAAAHLHAATEYINEAKLQHPRTSAKPGQNVDQDLEKLGKAAGDLTVKLNSLKDLFGKS